MIESYSFGKIKIDGKTYTKDIIILPNGDVLSPWWRKTGHKLAISDIDIILKAAPNILVVGTGTPGMMKPAPSLESDLYKKGITLVVAPTRQAANTYNAQAEKQEIVVACFHLTC